MVSRRVLIVLLVCTFACALPSPCAASRRPVHPMSISCVCLYKPTDFIDNICDLLSMLATFQHLQHKRYHPDREIALKGLNYCLKQELRSLDLYIIALEPQRIFLIINKEFIHDFEPLVTFAPDQYYVSVEDSSMHEQLNGVAQHIKQVLVR